MALRELREACVGLRLMFDRMLQAGFTVFHESTYNVVQAYIRGSKRAHSRHLGWLVYKLQFCKCSCWASLLQRCSSKSQSLCATNTAPIQALPGSWKGEVWTYPRATLDAPSPLIAEPTPNLSTLSYAVKEIMKEAHRKKSPARQENKKSCTTRLGQHRQSSSFRWDSRLLRMRVALAHGPACRFLTWGLLTAFLLLYRPITTLN